jgi:hypothetical protein
VSRYNSGVNWLSLHWFDLLQSLGIIGSLAIASYSTRRDERAQKVGNSLTINGGYQEIQKQLIFHPNLERVFDEKADIEHEPISIQEEAFVKMTIAQLSTVCRAMKQGEFVELEGLERDIRGFFGLPIPKAVWEKFKPVQDRSFVLFVEKSLRSRPSLVQ